MGVQTELAAGLFQAAHEKVLPAHPALEDAEGVLAQRTTGGDLGLGAAGLVGDGHADAHDLRSAGIDVRVGVGVPVRRPATVYTSNLMYTSVTEPCERISSSMTL